MLRLGMCAVLLAGVTSAAVGQVIPGWDPGWLSATPEYIQVSNLEGTYTAASGVLGIDAKTGGPTVTVHWDTGEDWTLDGTDAILEAIGKLYSDSSGIAPLLPNQARGRFNGDGVGLSDPALDWRIGWDFGALQAWVLGGVLDIYEVVEIYDSGLLEGSGLITATSGLLVDLNLWPSDQQSSLSSFTFSIHDDPAPVNISDFSQDFAGDMFLTFWPDDDHGVPEPATLALLAGGFGLTVLRRRR
ncbi:MAG: PEP-CTERM sorting domain-containing protein [Phycisphaerae bacterium]|nr:PEP-CTERM sorting domain-containing protein [Phycisphaerae bacterium]